MRREHVSLKRQNYPVAPNILNQNFKVQRSDQVWVSDITCIETKQGWMYLTAIIDLFNRKVEGWSMADNLTTQSTIIPAFSMAIESTQITQNLIFHSDRAHNIQVKNSGMSLKNTKV